MRPWSGPKHRRLAIFNLTFLLHYKSCRQNAALKLKSKAGPFLEGCPILVNAMDDRANLAFAALPERIYVIVDGKVVLQGGLGPFNYNIEEVEHFLENKKVK